MSTIYTCAQITEGSAPTAFIERKLHSSTSAKIDECGVYIFNTSNIPPYFQLSVQNLHEWLRGYVKEKAIVNSHQYFNALKDLEMPAITPPMCAINYKADSDETKDKLQQLGMFPGPGDRKNLWIGSPTLEQVRGLLALGLPVMNVTPAGNTSLSGMLAFYYGWKAVVAGALFHLQGEHLREIRYVIPDGADMLPIDQPILRPGMESDDEDSKLDLDEEDIWKAEKTYTVLPEHSSLVYIAGAGSDVESKIAFEDLKPSLSDDSGFVFPYFHGLLEPSKEFASTIFFRYFSKCFSSNFDEAAQMIPILRSGFRSLSGSMAGRALTHALFGIQAGFEAGGKTVILVDNAQYHGFVLQTGVSEIMVLNKGIKMFPVPRKELLEGIQLLDIHTTALKEIAKILGGISMKEDGGKVLIKSGDINTSRKLANAFRARQVSLEEQYTLSLKSWVEKLAYGETFFAPSVSNVQACMVAMMGQGNLDGPFHATWENLTSSNVIRRSLAVFGPLVPTLVAGTKIVSIAPPGKTDPNLAEPEKGQRVLRYIPIYLHSIGQATQEWVSIQSKHQMKFFLPKKGTGVSFTDRSKDVGVASGAEMIPFYETLRGFAYHGQSVDAAGSKRSADGDTREGSSKKKKGNSSEVVAGSSLF